MYSRAVLELGDLSQLLWAAQGVTALGGLRTAPSAGALYSIRTYVLATGVRSVTPGLYLYDSDNHEMKAVVEGRLRNRLAVCKLDACAEHAPALIVLASDYCSPQREFGDKAERLVQIEAGHIGQSVCLQASALALGAIGLGVFDPQIVQRAIGLPETHLPIYLLAVGRIESC